MPMQYCEPKSLAAAEDKVSHEINASKLLAVEKLLWGHKPKKPGEGMQGGFSTATLKVSHTGTCCISLAATISGHDSC